MPEIRPVSNRPDLHFLNNKPPPGSSSLNKWSADCLCIMKPQFGGKARMLPKETSCDSRQRLRLGRHFIRRNSTYLAIFTTLTVSFAKLPELSASTIYWDSDGDAGKQCAARHRPRWDGSSWDTTSPLWWDGSSQFCDQAWQNANYDTAVFTGTAGTITLDSGTTINAGSLVFDTTGQHDHRRYAEFHSASDRDLDTDHRRGRFEHRDDRLHAHPYERPRDHRRRHRHAHPWGETAVG